MSSYESRGQFGQQEQFGQPEQQPAGQQRGERRSAGPGSGAQRRPDQERRRYNDEVYPPPGYRAPDQVPTEWVPRPDLFHPYQNPVIRPRPGQGQAAGPRVPSPGARGRQPWDLVPPEWEHSQSGESEPRLPVFRETTPRETAPAPRATRKHGLRAAESFWYVLGCIAAGAAYVLKLPAKKAAAEVLTELHRAGGGPGEGYGLGGAERFWYVLLCLPFGGAYFAKVSAKKALWEMVTLLESAPDAYRNALARALYGDQRP